MKNKSAWLLIFVLAAAAIHGRPAETCPPGFCPGSNVRVSVGKAKNVPHMWDGLDGVIQVYHSDQCEVTIRYSENENPVTVLIPTKVLYAHSGL